MPKPRPKKKFDLTTSTSRTVKVFSHQTGQAKSKPRDLSRSAMTPGKRISKKGKTYWESRKNRSDKTGSRL